MNLLSKAGFRELVDHVGDLCISLYMPTHFTHREEQQKDLIRWRNLIDKARAQITRFTPFMRQPDVEALLQPAIGLQISSDWGEYQTESVALFLSTDFSRPYYLPVAAPPLVMVGGRFYIRPLLPLLAENGRFYLLAFSQNQVSLFHATRHTMEEVELRGVPTSLDEALAIDDPQKQLQFHGAASAPGAAGSRAAIFYSHGTAASTKKDSLRRYCQQVNAGLHRTLHAESAPLVLACVGYLFDIYRRANSYPHLFPICIEGSPDRVSAKEFHQKGWDLMRPLFQQARQEALGRLWQRLGEGQATTNLPRIVAAAFAGRVETLFTAVEGWQWGAFNQHTCEVYLHEYGVPNDQELLNLAAIFTLRHGGQVYTLFPDDLAENVKLAAIFRY